MDLRGGIRFGDACICGVGMPRAKAQDKEPIAISMYLWDRTMMRQLTPYLEEKFPEIDFTFVPAYNTMDYYKDMVYRGDELPDIITCRRFSLNDAAALSPYLMDLSDTEVAGTFYTSYLDVNKEKNGRDSLAARLRRGGLSGRQQDAV